MRNLFVAGHGGMVGSSICSLVAARKEYNLITAERSCLDLTDQSQVKAFFDSQEIDEVILAAARVGGIYANNNFPADFIRDNLAIQTNVIHEAHLSGVNKLMFLGSSCIYPRDAKQPIEETQLLAGRLEATNEPYAIAKIAGLKMCESYRRQYGCDFRAVMPTNLYGPGDNYDSLNSHVIPALLRRIHSAKINGLEKVNIWGSGSQLREFLYVGDMAQATMVLHGLGKQEYEALVGTGPLQVNVGTGVDITIKELAEIICKVVGYSGALAFDTSQPEGTPRKVLDITKVASVGWSPAVSLVDGLMVAYEAMKLDVTSLATDVQT